MNAKEKFDRSVRMIESMIDSPEQLTTRYIAAAIARDNGLDYRDMSTVITYLTGRSLNDYIRERKMMHSYSCLIAAADFDAEKLVGISGYDNQSSYSKKFKETFAMTPKEAYKKKNKALLQPPDTWDRLSEGKIMTAMTSGPHIDKFTSKFGLSPETFAKISEAQDLQALYEFDDVQSETAFELALKYKGIGLKAAFEYVDDYCLQFCTDKDGNFVNPPGSLRSLILSGDTLFRTAFDYNMSVSEALSLIRDVQESGYDIDKVDPCALDAYERGEFNYTFAQIMDFYKIFEEHKGIDFEEFLMNVADGVPPEEAVDYLDDLMAMDLPD